MPRRSRRRRRGRHSARSSREIRIIAGAGAGIALVVAVIVSLFVIRPRPVERDADTLCPVSGPSAVTAILVDTSDRVSALSRADILGRLDDEVRAGEPDELFLAFETQVESGGVLEPLVETCHPGDPDRANPLIQSRQLIAKRLDERFLEPLREVFSELLDREEAANSPLMESVQSVAVTVFGRREHADVPKRLLLVSDLMQNTHSLSFFRQQVDYDAFAASRSAAVLSTDLDGVAVEVLFVQREAHGRLESTRGLAEFWARWIEDQGGVVKPVVRIDGMN